MNGLIMAAQLLAGLSILVILHELGHFLAARAFGIKVEKFYLFFDAWGFKLISFNYKGCEYGIGWLPLGGYVKIAGMIDESMDTEQMQQPAQPWEFRSKPAWQRLIVMIGGVTVNILLGIFIFWMLVWRYGETYIPNSEAKYGIVARQLATEIGLKTGDRIVAANGKTLEAFDDILSPEVLLGNVKLTVERGTEKVFVEVPSNFIERISDEGPESFVEPRRKFSIEGIAPGGGAQKAGLQAGDQILAVDTVKIDYFDQLQAALDNNKSDTVLLSVVRNTQVLSLPAFIDEDGKLGFNAQFSGLTTKTREYGFFAAIPRGAAKAWETLVVNVKGMGKVVSGEVKASKALQGPIGIASVYGATFDWFRFWSLTGILSMVLAFMNILPIPALDGGHTVFLLIEMAIGRPVSDKIMERAQMVGFFILIGLMVFAFGNDIFKLIK